MVASETPESKVDHSAIWAARSAELVTWANRWVNRRDCWGAYRPIDERGKIWIKNGVEKKLGNNTTRKGKLTDAIIKQHFEATLPEHVIGLHTTSPDNTSLWGAVEIDAHGKITPELSERNLKAALGWYDSLVSMGFRPLLTDSNGKGGFHVRPLLSAQVPTHRMYWFLHWLIRDYATRGFKTPPECFPKQPSITNYGNWLRLPGRHHTREHWCKVWDGKDWVEGNTAIDFLLSLDGDPPTLIPTDIEWQYRIGEYMAKLPTGLGEGEHRDDHAYRFLAFMVRDLGRDDGYALEWAARWDSMNSVAKGTDRLREILDSVHQHGKNGYGSGLGGKSEKCNVTIHFPPQTDPETEKPNLTDTGNAMRLIQTYGTDLRYIYLRRKWLSWSGRNWDIENQGRVVADAKRMTLDLFAWAKDRFKVLQKQLEEMADEEG